MRVVFFGTPQFAVPTLAALRAAGHEIVLLISQPDKPSGRGLKVAPTPTKQWASAHGVAVYQAPKVNNDEVRQRLAEASPDVIAVAAYGKILPKWILDLPRFGAINVHASLLPKYRGAAPIQWAIIRGETVSGVTIMQMDPGMDTGDILLQGSLPIGPYMTAGELHDRSFHPEAACPFAGGAPQRDRLGGVLRSLSGPSFPHGHGRAPEIYRRLSRTGCVRSIPRPEPVTMATFPSSSPGIITINSSSFFV